MQTLTFYITSLKLLSIITLDFFSVLIGAGVPLLVFYLTLHKDKIKEEKKQEEIYDFRMQYLATLVKSSVKHTRNIIKNLGELCNNIKEDDLTFGLLTHNPNNSFERIQELIKHEGYFSAYISTFGKDKTDKYNVFAETVDYFTLQIEQIFDMNEKAHMYDYERKIKFNDLTYDAINLTMSPAIIERLKIDEKKNLDIIMNKYHKNLPEIKSEKESLEQHYILIRKLLEDVFRNYHSDNEFIPLLDKIKRSSLLFNEIKRQNAVTGKNINQIKSTLEESLKEYENITSPLINRTALK